MDKWLENEYVSWNLDACIYSVQDERRPYDPKFREDMILDLVWWINKICVAIYDFFFLIGSKGHFWKVKNFLSFSIFTLSLGLVLKFRTYMDQSLIFWPKTQFSKCNAKSFPPLFTKYWLVKGNFFFLSSRNNIIVNFITY